MTGPGGGGAIDPLFDLRGRVAVVTGGSRGLGREMALAFAAHGADVVIASRKLDACEAVASEIEALGRRSLAVAYHAGEWEDSDRLHQTVYDHFGRVDVLVNNAGMSPLYPSVDAIGEDLYDKVMGVNLKGPFRLSALIGTRMAGPDHGGSNGGSIIFVSSIASQRPSPIELVYGAAKAGVNNLTVGLARTLGPRVRVNCIVPGPVPHRHLAGVGPRRLHPPRPDGLRARPRWRARRDRRRRAVPRERCLVVHHRHPDQRRRRTALTRPSRPATLVRWPVGERASGTMEGVWRRCEGGVERGR